MDGKGLEVYRRVQAPRVDPREPTGEGVKRLTSDLDALFPSADETLNRELAQVLIYLRSPKVLQELISRKAF